MNMTLKTGTVIAALMVGSGMVFAETVPVLDEDVKGVLDTIKDDYLKQIRDAIGKTSDDKDQNTLSGKLKRQIEYSQGDKAEGYKDKQLAIDSNGWKYLNKDEFKDVMNNGATGCASIKSAIKDKKTETPQEALERTRQQVALNRAVADMIYKNADARIDKLNDLTQQINAAGDPKQKDELQLRISAEQMMLANEQTKIAALDMEQRAMAAIDEQIKKEIIREKLGGGTSSWISSLTGGSSGTGSPTGTGATTGATSSSALSVDCS